ncbi:hypothetical protein B0J13DRAFT_533393 [Dactylonectria estremocensis]|uniref:Uncharacterized protein n=1 Tax=Dactylonectria estremocensis TaxID=1079267 RepID=A0A9P9DA82_9HYPO|nr:hypothetical protein B0J13DRAFT_533393 [Dactylonectria estremocensis]
MKISAAFASFVAVALNASTASAAECGNWGTGNKGIGTCAGRSGNYEDRQTFCSSLAGQSTWSRTCQHGRNSGSCHFEYRGPGMPQQLCWDAFENIINQCFNTQNGPGYHSGSYSYNGHFFLIDRCSA